MKILFSNSKFLFVLTLLFISLKGNAQFTKEYGNTFDESFTKVIRNGTNYYVLGRSQTTANASNRASVSRINASGQHLWTVSLTIPSEWSDGVLTPTGELMVVGHTLPADATAKSLMGLITAAGTFSWVRSYDVPGREFFTRIVRTPVMQNFQYYVLGSQYDPINPSPTWDDVVLLNVNTAGVINWKRKFSSTADDEWVRDMEVLPNGELVLVGNHGTNGIIVKVDADGVLVNAATPESLAFSYYDIIRNNSGGFYAVGAVIGNFTPYLIRYDSDFIPSWHISISGLTAISQVWEDPATARTYVTGTGVFNGKSRAVLIRFVEKGSPSIEWVRFLDNGEISYAGGSYWFMAPNQIAFTDGRLPAAGGFGGLCAFLHINDMELASCMTKNATLGIQARTHIYNSPDITTAFFDIPRGTDILSSSLIWKDQNACQIPCTAAFTFQNISPCGNVQFANQSTGAAPLTYSWNFSDLGSGVNNTSTATSPSHQFSFCGNFKVCLKITASDGCMDSICKTVTYFDNVKPIIACPKDTILPCNSSVNPSNTGFATATDNCMSSTAIGITFADMLSGQLPCNATFMRTWEVTDGCANTASCKQVIKVQDTKLPKVICPPNLNLQCNTNTNPPATGVATATDDCTPTASILLSHFDKMSGLLPCDGLITRTWEATDDCKNKSTCVQILKIKDTIPPVIKCPKDLTLQCRADTNTAATSIATATDNCTPTVSILITHSDALVGQYPCNATITRTWVAVDQCKNLSRCIQIIKVKDTIPPDISCPRNPTVNTNPGLCYFTGNFPSATATDSCGSSSTITCSLLTTTSAILITPSTQYPKGINTITCFAVDDCGNQSKNCTFTLTVVDNEPPSITCLLSMSVLGTFDSSGQCTAVVKNIAPIAVDNCPMLQVNYILTGATVGLGVNDVSGTNFMSGTTTVTYIATDMAGNKDTCSFIIAVQCEDQWNCPCPNGVVGGPNLVLNGNFSGDTSDFTNDFSYFSPLGFTSVGYYSVLTNTDVPLVNNQWACSDHTTGVGSFLICDGASSTGTVAWKQIIPGSDSGLFNLCFYSNNLVIPSKNYDDPVLAVFINGVQVIANTTIPEIPDMWTPFNITWAGKLPATIEIRTILNQVVGNDFALDDISFTQCATYAADSCVCGSFTNLSARMNIGQQNVAFQCEKTYQLDCPPVFQFGGDFNCKGNDCDTLTKVEWNINGPIGGGGTVLAAPGFSLPLNSTSFSLPGLYTLTLTGYCDGKPCPPCIIYFESKGCDSSWSCPCNNGTSGKPDLIKNGHFTLGNDGSFTNNFIFFNPGNSTALGGYSVVNNAQVPQANSQWACSDHTTGSGLFLIVDGASSSGTVAWKQTISGTDSGSFNLCFYANNLVIPSKDYDDPVLAVVINGIQVIANTIIPEIPDTWMPFNVTWLGKLPATIEIRTTLNQVVGNDFALDDISFTKCASYTSDSCDCGSFTNLSARLFLGAQNLSIQCGKTYQLDCPPVFQFGGEFNCKGNDCDTLTKVEWNINGPIGGGGTVLAGPGFTLPLNANSFSQPGLYTLTLVGYCDGKPCPPCIIYFESKGCKGCCRDSSAFFNTAANFNPLGEVGDCVIFMKGTGLDSCKQITWSWGDNQTTGPVGNATSVSHVYSGTGTYNVCYLIEELDANGKVCWSYKKCDSVYVICGDCDSVSLSVIPSSQNGDTCCYKLYLNNTNPALISNIHINAQAPVTFIGANPALGWQVGPGPSLLQWALASGGTLPTGTNILIGTICIKAQGQFPQNFTVQFLELVGPNNFKPHCVDTLITECRADSCVCGSFDNLSVRLFLGAQNLSIQCGKTYQLDCPPVFQFGGEFNCKGNDCDTLTKVEWNINGPSGGGGTVLAGPGFTLPLNANSFSLPGLYTLTLVGYCDGKPCPPCIIYFESKGCKGCCRDSSAFFNAAANFNPLGEVGDCVIFMNGTGLDSCMQITWSWGDNQTTGPVGNATSVSHIYSGTGTYNVCYLIEELDANGKVCWNYKKCDSVYVICDSCCKDKDIFCQNVMNTVSITVDSTICKITFNIGDLPPCDFIESINWGDTSLSSYGPFNSGSMPMHTYSLSGTYIITYLAIEIDPLTGFICYEKIIKDTITVKCGPCTYNLVPNPSFEVYDSCPSGLAPPFTASIWTLPSTGSSDYYNSCASGGSGVSTPSNSFGTQLPHTGAGYAGFILRPTNNYREYLEVPLLTPLVSGCQYQVSFYVSLADEARWAIDKFGAYLSIGAVGPIPLAPAFTWLTPQVNHPLGNFIIDKIGWTLISGTYLATGGEDHLVIGNFYDNVGTTPVTGLSGFYPGSYYYIDDVSVCSGCPSQTIDSSCCADSTVFAGLINQGFTIVKSDCKVTVTAPQFDSCYYFGTPPSIDGSIVSQVITDPSGSWMYNFTQSGVHQICATVFDGCNVKKMCTRFEVKCDTCKCGKFSNVFLRPAQGASSIPVSCDGDAPIVPCPSIGKPFNISGQFICDGGQCPSSTPMNWILLDPMGQIVDSGVLISNPYWSLNLTSIHFGKKGTYCLQLFGHCGSQLCKCVIKFTFKEACPCDDCTCGEFTEMFIRSGQGPSQPIFCDTSFNTERYIFNSCEACNKVCPGVCFLEAGGDLCKCYLDHTRTSSGVKLPCPPNGQDVVITGQVGCQGKDCPKTTLMDWVLSDPNGLVIASMQNVPATPNFTVHISPLLLTQSNDYTLRLISQCGGKECICEVKFQMEAPCPDKCECDKFSILSSISRGPIVDKHCGDTIIIPKGFSLFFSAAFNCKGICPPYPQKVAWTLTGPIGFKPINGIAKATPNLNLTIDETTFTLPGIYVLTMIGHCGNKECKCTITFINAVGQSTPLKPHAVVHELKVIPNPNFGLFIVDLSSPAIFGTMIRVVGLTGQLMFEQKAEIGSKAQNINATFLSPGLYFVQIITEGKPTAVEKFVKH